MDQSGRHSERDGNHALLEVRDLATHFPVRRGAFGGLVGHVKAVDGVSFSIRHGRSLGLVGESGCGKSTLGRTILRLTTPTRGRAFLEGVELFSLNRSDLRHARRKMQMIFQDPAGSLNPRMTIGSIVAEPLVVHHVGTRTERRHRVAELLERVGLRNAHRRRYPHEFSGGQRQRVGIARAIALNPRLIVGDEPVSALDVSVQSQILNLLADLQEELGVSYLFISHDLGVVRQVCHDVAVMYLGRIVEAAPIDELFDNPRHPYTHALLAAIPSLDPTERRLIHHGARDAAEGARANDDGPVARRTPPPVVAGEPPDPINPPTGCPFHPRCPHATDECRQTVPHLTARSVIGAPHLVACHRADEELATQRT